MSARLSARLALDSSGMDAPSRKALKRRIRAAKNKESAQRSRKRKRARLDYLEDFTKEQTTRLATVLRRMAELEEENRELRAGYGAPPRARATTGGGERVPVLTSLLSGHSTNSFSLAAQAAPAAAAATPATAAAALAVRAAPPPPPPPPVSSAASGACSGRRCPPARPGLLGPLLGDFAIMDLPLPGPLDSSEGASDCGSPRSFSAESLCSESDDAATFLASDFDEMVALLSGGGAGGDLQGLDPLMI